MDCWQFEQNKLDVRSTGNCSGQFLQTKPLISELRILPSNAMEIKRGRKQCHPISIRKPYIHQEKMHTICFSVPKSVEGRFIQPIHQSSLLSACAFKAGVHITRGNREVSNNSAQTQQRKGTESQLP